MEIISDKVILIEKSQTIFLSLLNQQYRIGK